MKFEKTLIPTGLCLGLTLLPSTFIEAQGKPDPTPINAVSKSETGQYEFKKAYQRAGEPTMLVIVGVQNEGDRVFVPRASRNVNDTRELNGQQGEQVIGQLSSNRYTGRGLNLFDASAVSTSFQAGIEEILLKNNDIDLVNLDALAERDRREIQLLQLNNEPAAVRLLAQKVNAELVILVRMIQTEQVLQQGANYRVIVDMVDSTTGRKIGGFGFDWERGTDGRMIKRYAEAVTNKLIYQFSDWYQGDFGAKEKRYGLKVVGLKNTENVMAVSELLKGTPGVTYVKVHSFTTSSETTITQFRIKSRSSVMELMFHLKGEAGKLGLTLEGIDGTGSSILMRATGEAKKVAFTPIDPSDYAKILMDPSHPRYQEMLKLLQERYRAAASPEIGMLINRVLTSEEREKVILTESNGEEARPNGIFDGRMLIVDDDSTGPNPTYAKLVQTKVMEGDLYAQFQSLGITQASRAQKMRNALTQAFGRERSVASDVEVLQKLVTMSGLRYLVLGEGRIEEGQKPGVTYTYRVIEMSTGRTVAGIGWSSENSAYPLNINERYEKRLSNYVSAHLLAQLMQVWVPGGDLKVKVNGVSGQRDVITLMTALEASSDPITGASFSGFDQLNQSGTFTLSGSGSMNDLLQSLNQLQEQLPFRIEKVNPETGEVILRLTP